MENLFNMGEHGIYVWPCYGVAAVLLVGLLVASVAGLKKNRRELAQLETVLGVEKSGK